MKNKYDYIIIGAGAAGSNLLMEFMRHQFFLKKRILVLDSKLKNKDDKTWCFWEEGSSEIDELVSHEWKTANFITNHNNLKIELYPFKYKKIKSIDLYNHISELIIQKDEIDFKNEKVLKIEEEDSVKVITTQEEYIAELVFDSRIDPEFYQTTDSTLKVQQHFVGWFIRTNEKIFNPEEFILMDYRVKWEGDTAFTYVLPTTQNEALIEYTLFTPYLLEEQDYEIKIKEYINEILGITDFEIVDKEAGIIPMSNYKFHKLNSDKVIKIGTAGSWVKASSGYSFNNSRKLSKKIANNLINQKKPDYNLFQGRYRMYDTIFLDILQKDNKKGEKIFIEMFKRNKINKVFRFLDEETKIIDELSIISKFNPIPFLKALFRQIFRR